MVDNCANPECNKTLHYLREGRIFVLDVASATLGADGKRMRHMKHYWLCGDCAPSFVVECSQDSGILVRQKHANAAGAVQLLAS